MIPIDWRNIQMPYMLKLVQCNVGLDHMEQAGGFMCRLAFVILRLNIHCKLPVLNCLHHRIAAQLIL